MIRILFIAALAAAGLAAAGLEVGVVDIPAGVQRVTVGVTGAEVEPLEAAAEPVDGIARLAFRPFAGTGRFTITVSAGRFTAVREVERPEGEELTVLCFSAADGFLDTAAVELTLRDLVPLQGLTKLVLFRFPAGGGKPAPWLERTLPADGDVAAFRISALPYGRYAVSVGQDLDGNGWFENGEPRIPAGQDGPTLIPVPEAAASIFMIDRPSGTIDASLQHGFERTAVLELAVQGFRNDKGVVQVTLFYNRDGFPDRPDKAFASASAPIRNGRAVVTFRDVPWGTWACGLFHDENTNARMDTNFFGVPREGYGATNDARGTLGPPAFEDAAFAIMQADVKIKVNMVY